MAGLGNITTTLITTRGLFTAGEIVPPGFTALTFGAGVTPWFRLYVGPNFTPTLTGGGSAGSRVYQPGEFAKSWRPVDPITGKAYDGPTMEVPGPNANEWMVVPLDKEAEYFGEAGKIVTLKFNFAGKEHEKIYKVSTKQAKRIVEVANFINATRARVNVAISGIKQVATRALVEVKKVRLRKKSTKY